MEMQRFKSIIVSSAVALALTAANLSAQQGPAVPGSGSGGGGDASLAEQQTQTGILTTIDADTGTIAGAVKNEDAAHISGDVGVAVLTKRTDTAASSAGTDGDYATLNSDADGNLRVTDAGVGATTDAPPSAGGCAGLCRLHACGQRQRRLPHDAVWGGAMNADVGGLSCHCINCNV